MVLAPVLLKPDRSAFANIEDPDRLASSLDQVVWLAGGLGVGLASGSVQHDRG